MDLKNFVDTLNDLPLYSSDNKRISYIRNTSLLHTYENFKFNQNNYFFVKTENVFDVKQINVKSLSSSMRMQNWPAKVHFFWTRKWGFFCRLNLKGFLVSWFQCRESFKKQFVLEKKSTKKIADVATCVRCCFYGLTSPHQNKWKYILIIMSLLLF